jgi:prepilin-type N-terminal cleavage/methylation domain-containing protein
MLTPRRAMTLLEVCVVLAMLGILLGVVALQMGSRSSGKPPRRTLADVRRHAQLAALSGKRAMSLGISVADSVMQFAVLPTGEVISDSPLPADSIEAHVLWEADVATAR